MKFFDNFYKNVGKILTNFLVGRFFGGQKASRRERSFLVGREFIGAKEASRRSWKEAFWWKDSFQMRRKLPDERKLLFLLGGRLSNRTEAFKFKWEASLLAVCASNKFSWQPMREAFVKFCERNKWATKNVNNFTGKSWSDFL